MSIAERIQTTINKMTALRMFTHNKMLLRERITLDDLALATGLSAAEATWIIEAQLNQFHGEMYQSLAAELAVFCAKDHTVPDWMKDMHKTIIHDVRMASRQLDRGTQFDRLARDAVLADYVTVPEEVQEDSNMVLDLIRKEVLLDDETSRLPVQSGNRLGQGLRSEGRQTNAVSNLSVVFSDPEADYSIHRQRTPKLRRPEVFERQPNHAVPETVEQLQEINARMVALGFIPRDITSGMRPLSHGQTPGVYPILRYTYIGRWPLNVKLEFPALAGFPTLEFM